jgi:hypothetical protein
MAITRPGSPIIAPFFGLQGANATRFQKASQEGVGLMRKAKAIYNFAADGGVIGLITPVRNAVIPANAIVFGGLAIPTTALAGATATIAIGTSAGSSAASLKAATAVATYSLNAILPLIPVFTAGSAFKMTAAGKITCTVAVAALTAGVLEIEVYFMECTN